MNTPRPLLSDCNLQVRCSGGDGSGDPDNICGDRPNNGGCNNGQPVTPGTSNLLQAYSNPNIEENDYSEITFCNGFFGLNNLAEAIRLGLAKSQGSARDNLDSYDNRARVFFHEVTHLDYFMNTPGQGPVIDDVKLKARIGGITETQNAYGALWTKVLANYRARGKGGYYTQRNGTLICPYPTRFQMTDPNFSGHLCLFRVSKVCDWKARAVRQSSRYVTRLN